MDNIDELIDNFNFISTKTGREEWDYFIHMKNRIKNVNENEINDILEDITFTLKRYKIAFIDNMKEDEYEQAENIQINVQKYIQEFESFKKNKSIEKSKQLISIAYEIFNSIYNSVSYTWEDELTESMDTCL